MPDALTMQSILYEYLGHHQLQADDHDVQQRQLIDHFKCQTLVGEELHTHVHDTIAECVRISGHFQHRWNATVVHDKCACQMLLQESKEIDYHMQTCQMMMMMILPLTL